MTRPLGARLSGTVLARWAMTLLTVLGVGACSRKEPSRVTPIAKVAMIEPGPQDAWWGRVEAGAARAARESGRVAFLPRAAAVAGAEPSQAALVRTMVAEGAGAVVVAPQSPEDQGLAAALRDAVSAGVPLVLIDDHGGAATAGIKTPRVLSDDAQAGVMAAEFMLSRLGETREVLVLGDGKGPHGSDKREIAFRDRMARESSVHTIDAPPGPGPQKRAAQLAVEYALDANRNICAIFCPDEQSTLGVLLALRERSIAGQIRLVGVDTNPTLVEAMAAGEIDALVIRRPGDMGHRAMLAAIGLLKGEPVEDLILTPVTLVPREAMHDKANMDLLLPDLARTGE